jgi:hypothetical protein
MVLANRKLNDGKVRPKLGILDFMGERLCGNDKAA